MDKKSSIYSVTCTIYNGRLPNNLYLSNNEEKCRYYFKNFLSVSVAMHKCASESYREPKIKNNPNKNI